jgi:hypothetical protein
MLALTIAVACSITAGDPAAAEAATAVDADRVMRTLEALPHARSVRASVEGSEKDTEGLAATERMIERALAEIAERVGAEVESQAVEWQPVSRSAEGLWTGRNWWIDLPGSVSPNEIVIVGAHYDAVAGTPGADDNGTGTAAALEVARVIAGFERERTVRVILFTAEEVGLIGARTHARETAQPEIASGEKTIVGMMSLEMLGYYSDEEGSQKSPIPAIPGIFEPPTVGDMIAVVGLARHGSFVSPLVNAMTTHGTTPVFALTMPAPLPDLGRSDHAPFWGIGVPAVMITDTANFRNPHYHQPTDTIDTLDRERYIGTVRGIVGAVAELAGATVAPDDTSPGDE